MQSTSAGTSTARISQAEALRVLDYVTGMTVDRAISALRFSPGHTCPPLERVISAGLAAARSESPEITGSLLVVASGRVGDGDAIMRLRRHAHGDAYWLTTHTTSIQVELAPDRGPARPPVPAAAEPNQSEKRLDA
jgi:ribosomal protein L22